MEAGSNTRDSLFTFVCESGSAAEKNILQVKFRLFAVPVYFIEVCPAELTKSNGREPKGQGWFAKGGIIL